MADRVRLGPWSVVVPDGFEVRREGPPDDRALDGTLGADGDAALLREQLTATIDAVSLLAPQRRFGIPVAGLLVAVARRGDATLDRLADAGLALLARPGHRLAQVVEVTGRRPTTAVGQAAVEIEAHGHLDRFAGGWVVRAALGLARVNPVRARVILFDRGDLRHLAAAVGGRRDADRVNALLDELVATSEWSTDTT